MLEDSTEVRIMSKARQKNLRDPGRSRAHFERIFEDFLSDQELDGKTLFDLGPGQFDFGVLARLRGAQTWSIDDDLAVIELGKYKGFPTFHGKIQEIHARDFPIAFDGLFCKFSINAFWYYKDLNKLSFHMHELISMIKPEGWGWIAPWNGAPQKESLSRQEKRQILAFQAEQFRKFDFRAFDLPEATARHYGITGRVENHALFVRGLRVPAGLSRFEMPL